MICARAAVVRSIRNATARNNMLKLGKYRHYKGGIYEVIGVAKHSETLEEMAVYRHDDDGSLWVRPLTMFTEDVTIDGKKQPRFEKID